MNFQTLENVNLEQLTKTFNQSFANYFIPIQLTKEQLQEKIHSEGIKLQLSIGAFDDKNLVGFILHGYQIIDGEKVVYNAGTGVVPEKRGQNLSTRLYHSILTDLRKKGISKCLLEVIEDNQTAIKIYQSLGFTNVRKLHCYKGTLKSNILRNEIEIQKSNSPDWVKLQSFWDWTPSWQNSPAAINKFSKKARYISITKNKQLSAYAIYNAESGRIYQFAVNKQHRGQGLGKALFAHINKNVDKELYITNIDEKANHTLNFLSNIGMNEHLKQLEMELKITELKPKSVLS